MFLLGLWCSKYRRKVIIGDVEKGLWHLIEVKAKGLNWKVLFDEKMPVSLSKIGPMLELRPHSGQGHQCGRDILKAGWNYRKRRRNLHLSDR